MAELTLRVLGSLELFANGKPIISNFRSDKVRALLVYLALEAGRPHQRHALVALLWPDFSKSAGLGNLRKALFYLREVIQAAALQSNQLLLTVDRQTVQLNPAAMATDAVQFEQLLADVARHEHDHRHSCPECLARLAEAESLYRGELLPGFGLPDTAAFEEWLLVKREQLQQQAILTLQNLADIYEQQKDYERVEKIATRLIMLDSYHEKAVRQLMRILTRTGRRQVALQIYDRLADRLQSEIGVLPEERTSALLQRIVEGDILETDKVMRQMHHFPIQYTPFLGRESDLARVNHLLLDAHCRLLTIVGAGGVGKTRLAIEAAKRAAEGQRFADGIYFARLSAVASGDDLPAALATLLSLPPRGNAPLLTQVFDFLHTRNCLLLLDNFEHLAGNERVVADLLAAAPELTLLVTSRQPLYLRAEQQVRLEGMAYPAQPLNGEEKAVLDQVHAYDAVRLFLQSARMVRSDFAITPANVQATIQLSRLTQGVPLALVIAAGWVRIMDVGRIAEMIEESPVFLTSPVQDVPDRHRSMIAVFDYSWKLLAPRERMTLAKASIFREPFTLATAVAVLETTISDVAVLLDKSLLQSPTSGRYGLHELLRHYALGKLRELDDGSEIEARTRRKHSAHYLNMVAQTAPAFYGSEPQAADQTLRRRLGNVTQAWWWALEHAAEPAQQHIIGLSVDGLGRFFDFRGLSGEGERMMKGGVVKLEALVNEGAVEGTAVALLSQLLGWQAHFKNRLGDAEEAIQHAQKALAYSLEPEAAARTKCLLGELLPNIGQFDQAERYLQEALSYFREVDDNTGLAQALGRMGTMLWRRGNYQQAVPVLEEALAMQEKLGNKRALATLYSSIAGIHYEHNHFKEAQAYVEQARTIYTEIGNVIGVAQTDGYLALLNLKLGHFELALELNQRELDLFRSMGDRKAVSTTIGNRGTIFTEVGEFDEALICYQEAIQLTNELGLFWHQAMYQTSLAAVWLEKGAHDEAMALFKKATPVLRQHGAQFYVVGPLIGEARILLADGRLAEAQTLLDEALALAEQLKHREYIFEARMLIARLDFAQGKTEQAQGALRQLLADTADQAEQAKLHYELWRMNASHEHARTAYELYRQLYEQLHKYAFQRHLGQLQVVFSAKT